MPKSACARAQFLLLIVLLTMEIKNYPKMRAPILPLIVFLTIRMNSPVKTQKWYPLTAIFKKWKIITKIHIGA